MKIRIKEANTTSRENATKLAGVELVLQELLKSQQQIQTHLGMGMKEKGEGSNSAKSQNQVNGTGKGIGTYQ